MEELKNALRVFIRIAEKTDASLEDGKVSITEGIGIAMSALGLINVIKTFGAVKTEFLNLTEEQKTALSAWFAQEFQLREEKAEEIIEQVFNGLLQLSNSIVLFKKAA